MKDGYFVIDADGHVHEDIGPLGNFRRYLDPRFRDRPIAVSGPEPIPADRHQGGKYGKRHGDPAIQIADMDIEGIDIQVIYPTALLGGYRWSDAEHSVALHRAYNDWLAEFCSHNPDRLKGVAALPVIDPDASARELERAITQLGFVGGMAHTWNPDHNIGESSYDDLYACAQQLNVPIAFHASGSEDCARFSTFLASHTMGHPREQMYSTVFVIYAGVLERSPRLIVGFLEGAVGWIPMLAERMDEEYEHRPFEAPLLTKPPSEYFKGGRVFFGAESGEWMIPTVARYLGTDQTLLFSSDYPHWDGEFPNATRHLTERTDLTDENKRNILGENARRFYPALAKIPAPA